MKRLSLFTLFAWLALVRFPGWAVGSSWTLTRSGDIRQDLVDICLLDDGLHGWALSSHNVILRTTDGFQTWTEVQVPGVGGFEGFSALDFVDASEGWAVTAYAGRVFHTVDGGLSWQLNHDTDGAWLEDVCFFDRLHGWAVGTYFVMRTEDGGETWLEDPSMGWGSLQCVTFASPLQGWMGSSFRIWHTEDGGQSWTIQESSVSDIRGLAFQDTLAGCAVGDGAYPPSFHAYYTSDGGLTWTPYPMVDGPGLRAVSLDGSGAGYAVGWEGAIFSTPDAGQTWVPEESGLNNNLNAVAVVPGVGTWAAGQLGTLLSRQSGRPEWSQLATVSNDLRSVAFGDSLHVLAVGARGILLRTIDGGLSWDEGWVEAGPAGGLRTVDLAGPDLAWTSGGQLDVPGVWRSTDGGVTWDLVPLPVQGHVDELDFADPLHGWCLVNPGNGHVCASIDGGLTWQEQPGAEFWAWTSLCAQDSLHAWLGGWEPEHGVIAHTTDGGQSWTPVVLPTTAVPYAVTFRDTLEGWCATDSGTVYHSLDGGLTWGAVHQVPGVTAWLDLALIPNWGVAVAGARLEPDESTTGLVDVAEYSQVADPLWYRSLEVPGSHFLGLEFWTLDHGFLVGRWGELYNASLPSSVRPDAGPPARPGSWLHLTALGNPASGTTILQIEAGDRAGEGGQAGALQAAVLPATGIRLDIYDLRGRRVRTLVGPPTGGWPIRLRWDGTTDRGRPVASGVYLAVVELAGQEAVTSFVRVR